MSEQDGTQKTTLQQPSYYDKDAWKEYWKARGQSWRTEPEINEERQNYLAQRRKIKPNVEQGNYPFKNTKLSRADIEWLLSTHENGRGPVDWNDESQREREGLDLRGADLRGSDLRGLPLARMIAGQDENKKREQYEKATIVIHNIDIQANHFEGADLSQAHLEGASLFNAHLEKANLISAHLEKAFLYKTHLEKASLSHAHLEDAILYEAHLEHVDLSHAHLERTDLRLAHLEGASLNEAHLEGVYLNFAHLEGAYLSSAFFDSETNLEKIALTSNKYGTASLCDIHWREVNIAVVDWSTISMLGDEDEAIRNKSIHRYERATRVYRQISAALRNQGINENAARFSYRAQLMQRKIFWYEGYYLKWLGSLFLDLLSGYGYRFWRSFLAYAIVIAVFAAIYFHFTPNLAWYESIVISMTAFHGRGFFSTQFSPGDPQAIVAAIEAFIGLFIEITLIATLTQRLFGK